MKRSTHITDETGKVLFRPVFIMDTPFKRVIGLMGKRTISPDAAYLFPRCTSIHTCFMRVPIDVVFLDSSLQVLGVETLAPWHLSQRPRGTHAIIETAAHAADAKGIEKTTTLIIRGDCDV